MFFTILIMKIHSTFFIAIFLVALTSCESKQKAKAKIFERKEVEDNKLMIKYAFSVKGETITDSAVIENNVIGTDSVSVTFDPDDPSKNTLDISK